MSSRWASENEEPTLDDLVSYANNEAYALNLIDEPIPTSKYTLRTPQKARAGDIPPPPSSVRPPNARRLSTRSILNLQSDMLGGDDGAMSETASTEGDTEMCTSPFDLNVLEQLTLTNLRGSFSSSNQSPLPTSSSSQAFHMKSILNQVLPDERDDEDDANNQESSTRRPCMSAWSESVTPYNRTHEDQRMKLRLTRMRAQMQLTISRLQRQNEDLRAALALSKATSAKREKQLAADHAFKLSSKEVSKQNTTTYMCIVTALETVAPNQSLEKATGRRHRHGEKCSNPL
ncbi:hypothetical protein, variant [Aphanomyces astaci]|uniref:Uncharacterized protein n=1 Tax=Aphanomyces astaci TaxID=112090 RepID=W4GP70_APHAT|nr:hypothetical protein, variant [Aphanomyces astaci]ETV80809.1 hypothetical protein, variant [Aphanomyces astaci]|eukprot:XP_009829756.1 hypothetical protein, variant [Aphanomyces astaci]